METAPGAPYSLVHEVLQTCVLDINGDGGEKVKLRCLSRGSHCGALHDIGQGPAAATLPESFVRHPGPTEDGVIEVRILRRSTGNKQQAGIEEQQQLHADSEPSRHAHVRTTQLAGTVCAGMSNRDLHTELCMAGEVVASSTWLS